jgi:5'-3' exonuclease
MKDKTGVEWEQYADWKALAGDTSDNIPGLRGIGPTMAAKLINQHGSLEKIPLLHYQQWKVTDLGATSQVLLDWRAEKDKKIEYCVRKFGVPWKRIEHQIETLLAPNQYQKLREVLDEDHFEATNVRHEILNYRSIIKLPLAPVVHYYSEEE